MLRRAARPLPRRGAFAAAHRRLDEALPGSGAVGERADRLARVPGRSRSSSSSRRCGSLADDFRERTERLFGLPEGEHVELELATRPAVVGLQLLPGRPAQPGGDQHRPARAVDVLAHLVAHEAYPGHHTEHSRKEVGPGPAPALAEETIFLVGTPQCLLAEGLADLGLEVLLGPRSRARSSPSTCGPSASPTTPRSSPRCARRASRSTRCGPTPPGCSMPTGDPATTSSTRSSAVGTAAPGPGHKSVEFLTPTRGGPTSPATSRACRCAGPSWPATRPVRHGCSPSSWCPPTWPRRIRSMSERSRNLPRRSCLSTPGSSDRFLAKAPTATADFVLPRPRGLGRTRTRRTRRGPRSCTRSRPRLGRAACCACASTPGIRPGPTATSSRSWPSAGNDSMRSCCPRSSRASDVVALDLLLTQVEYNAGLPAGHVGIEAQIETAEGPEQRRGDLCGVAPPRDDRLRAGRLRGLDRRCRC